MTKIEWTEKTWNPVTGCTKVSPGCDHCYAEGIARRFAGSKAFPNGFDVTLHPDRLGAPLTWRKPNRVFVNSMSDLFHQDVPDEYIAAVWCSMYWTSPAVRTLKPVQTFQILTKRHARMRSWVRGWGDREQRVAWVEAAAERGWCDDEDRRGAPFMPAVLRNVWLGVSAEDQKRADLRIPALLETPAAVRFVSAEPLLGVLQASYPSWVGLDWVIVGGESGPGARPMRLQWAKTLVAGCQELDIAVFVKQLGSAHGPHKGGDMATWPAELQVREYPTAVAA
jgi:protein gp37